MPLALSRTCALLCSGVAAALISLPARAQAVLGYGEDATAAPVGAIRLRLSNDWHRTSTSGVGNDTSYDSDRQFRASTIALDVGVLKRFSLGAVIPWITTKTLTFVSSTHPQGFLLDTLLDQSHNGWGNIEAFGKVVWLGEPGQQLRLAARKGLHVRSALVGGALLGTGIPGDPRDPFAVGTSDRSRALLARSATDVTVGSHLFGSIVARYVKPFSDNVLVAVHPADNPFANDAVAFLAQRKLGSSYEIELTPRYQLGRYFAVGAQYRYHHGAQASYIGTTTATVNDAPVTLDASTLNTGSELTEHRVGFGVVYSAVDAYTRNRSRLPIEVTFEHSKVVSVSGARPKDSQTTFSVRFFRRLRGVEFAPPARTPRAPTVEPSTP
ncbi:MAG: hypothetical protein ABI889_06440 [Gemmatimonadota bacterium]